MTALDINSHLQSNHGGNMNFICESRVLNRKLDVFNDPSEASVIGLNLMFFLKYWQSLAKKA